MILILLAAKQMARCYPSGHSRKDKSLLRTARRYSSPPGPRAPGLFPPQSPWSTLCTNPPGVGCSQQSPLSWPLLFFFATCHQPLSKGSLSHIFPCVPSCYSHCSGFSSDAQHFTRSCLLFVLYLVTAAPVLFLEKQLCLWYQRPSTLPHCTVRSQSSSLGLWFLSHNMFPTYVSGLKFDNSTPPPYYSHTG